MKRFLLAVLLFACITFSLAAQEPAAPKLFLEITETGMVAPEHIGISIRLPVTSEAEALTLRDELVQRFFSGVTYTAQLHTHSTTGPCEVKAL